HLCCYGHGRDLHSFPTRRSSDLAHALGFLHTLPHTAEGENLLAAVRHCLEDVGTHGVVAAALADAVPTPELVRCVVVGALGHASDRKSTRLNSSHVKISYAVFCL